MDNNLQIAINLLDNKELLGKEYLTIPEVKELLYDVDNISISGTVIDFAMKEKRDTFNDIRINHIKQTYMDIANKITDIKKLDKYPNYVFYMVDNIVFMKHDLISDIVYIRYWEFWELFEKRFNLNYNQISLLLKSFLQVNLDCHVNSTECESIVYLERYFK